MSSPAGRSIRLATLALLLAGCEEDGERPLGTALRGRWVSTFSSEFVQLQLDQAGSRITGRAELAPAGVRTGYHVQGVMRGDDLTLSLVPEGGGDAVAVRATLASDTLRSTLDGGGFRERFVPLVRSD